MHHTILIEPHNGKVAVTFPNLCGEPRKAFDTLAEAVAYVVAVEAAEDERAKRRRALFESTTIHNATPQE